MRESNVTVRNGIGCQKAHQKVCRSFFGQSVIIVRNRIRPQKLPQKAARGCLLEMLSGWVTLSVATSAQRVGYLLCQLPGYLLCPRGITMNATWACIKSVLGAGSCARVSEEHFVSGYPACGLCAGSGTIPVAQGIFMNGESGFVLAVEDHMAQQALRATPLLSEYGAPEQDSGGNGMRSMWCGGGGVRGKCV